MNGVLELIAVALAVGAALAYVLRRSLRAATILAKGEAPRCCTDKEGFSKHAALSACPDADSPAGPVSPCAGCTGCPQGRG